MCAMSIDKLERTKKKKREKIKTGCYYYASVTGNPSKRAESLGFVRLHLYLPGCGRLSALPERHTVGVKAPIAAVYRSAEATAVRWLGSLLPWARRRSAGRPSAENKPLLQPLEG